MPQRPNNAPADGSRLLRHARPLGPPKALERQRDCDPTAKWSYVLRVGGTLLKSQKWRALFCLAALISCCRGAGPIFWVLTAKLGVGVARVGRKARWFGITDAQVHRSFGLSGK